MSIPTATDQATIDAAIEFTRKVLDAAENSNQHGEDVICFLHRAYLSASGSSSSTEIPDWVKTGWKRSKGEAWEPTDPNGAGAKWLIENGFAERCDGRCGFEKFKDSMLRWTLAGKLAMQAIDLSSIKSVQPKRGK